LRKRRTTLTLPEESLAAAARLARSRRVNLSTVVAEALSEGLRSKMAIERSEEVLKSYQEAFAGFSDAELQILDGVILEPEPKR
jgi:post-segregation antitoxin (ccd killing protein)